MKKLSDIDIKNNIKAVSAIYKCPVCRDSGWLITNDEAHPCDCKRKEIKSYQARRSGLSPAMRSHTFENFRLSYYEEYMHIESKSYRQLASRAKSACNKFAGNIINGGHARSILLCGDVGRGKSHLAAAVANKLLDKDINVLFLVVPDFLDSIRASYNDAGEFSEVEIMSRAQQAGVLILDDLGAHNFSEWTKNKLFSLINYRVNYNAPFLITTNLSLYELNETVGTRTVSRIVEMCDLYSLVSDNDIRLLINQSTT